jgi:hypothetical protein
MLPSSQKERFTPWWPATPLQWATICMTPTDSPMSHPQRLPRPQPQLASFRQRTSVAARTRTCRVPASRTRPASVPIGFVSPTPLPIQPHRNQPLPAPRRSPIGFVSSPRPLASFRRNPLLPYTTRCRRTLHPEEIQPADNMGLMAQDRANTPACRPAGSRKLLKYRTLLSGIRRALLLFLCRRT